MSRTRIVVALGMGQVLGWGSSYYLAAILAAPMAAEFGVATAVIFGAFSAALALTALLGPAIGRRIDVAGGRDVLAVSNVVFAAALALLGLAQSVPVLVLGWLLLGVGMVLGLYDAAFATLAGLYGRGARGAITGITLLGGLASTVAWPVTAVLDAELGWRGACLAWAAAHVLVGLPVHRFLVPLGTQPPPAPRADGEAAPRVSGGQRAAMTLLALVFAVTWFSSTAMAAHLPRLLEMTGVGAAEAIAAAALVGPAQVGARLFEFGILQRFHPLLSARLAAAAHPVGATLLLALGAPFAAAFTVLHGAGNGILTIAKGTLPLALFGPVGYGHRQGVLMVPARFAQAAAPLVFAVLLERWGVGALLLTVGLGLTGLAALFALGAHMPQPRDA